MPDYGSMRIVPAVALTGQTASIGTTNLLASAPAGLYRATWYIETTSAGAAGTVLLTLGWNDGDAQTAVSATITLVTASAALSGMTVIRSAAGQNITYATTVAGAVGGPTYNLTLVLEAM